MPHLEISEVVLRHCYIANNSFQQNSRVLFTFVPNKPFRKILNISSQNSVLLKTFDSQFSHIDVRFMDLNSKLLEIEDNINITLVIN